MTVKTLIRVGLIVIILVLISTLSGCLKPPDEGGSYSSIPELIVDYDFEIDSFKIYVKSAVGDFKYDYVKVIVNDDEVIENRTYAFCYVIPNSTFSLDVEAQVEEDILYYYSCDIELLYEDDEVFIVIIEKIEISEDEIRVNEDDLPWKKILVRRK